MKAQDLKNSILQLAIQGKLVEQRTEEGTAKELIEKIKVEKEKLIKEGKIKKTKPLPEITEDEKPFDIPESWEWVRLGDLSSLITKGTTPRGGNVSYIDEGIGFLRAENVAGFDKLNLVDLKFVDENTHNTFLKRSILKENDILITIAGTLGRTAIVRKENLPLNSNQAVSLTRLIKSDLINLNYLVFAINAPIIQNSLIGRKKTTAIPNLTLEIINDCILPIPPLEEQKRIVSKIEELIPYVEKYDKAYTAVEELNKKFPEDMQKSILQYAIQGKLVEQREEDGTAEELYQQIKAEKERLIKDGKIKNTKPLSEITEDEIQFEIPENWKWVRLGDVFEINPRNKVRDELNVSFIPMALIEDGYVSEFTYEIRLWADVKKGYTHFQDEDIVMAKITPCFQNLKSALMKNLENGIGAGTTELHVLRPYSNICKEFFMWFIKSPNFVSTCIKNMTGTAGQKRVPTDVLKNYVVPLPPLAEQNRIVEKIEELLPYTKQLIKKID